MTIKKTTVEQRLIELDARCDKGKLVDAAGKEIYFYRLKGCWGNPPPDYQEILQRQNEELEKLRKRYTVIEMTCNPEGNCWCAEFAHGPMPGEARNCLCPDCLQKKLKRVNETTERPARCRNQPNA